MIKYCDKTGEIVEEDEEGQQMYYITLCFADPCKKQALEEIKEQCKWAGHW